MKHLCGSAGRRHDDAAARRTKRANIMMVRPREQDRRAVLLEGSELFLGLTEEESRKATRQMEENRFLRGATIFRKDDPSDTLFMLKEGLVKIVAPSGNGCRDDSLHPPADRHLRGTPPRRGEAAIQCPGRDGCPCRRPFTGRFYRGPVGDSPGPPEFHPDSVQAPGPCREGGHGIQTHQVVPAVGDGPPSDMRRARGRHSLGCHTPPVADARGPRGNDRHHPGNRHEPAEPPPPHGPGMGPWSSPRREPPTYGRLCAIWGYSAAREGTWTG